MAHYNLQMIIAVGFKVNNERAVQFRKWANTIIKDSTIKGWAIDDERLKNGGSVLTKEYFDRPLEQIREIRLSCILFCQLLCIGRSESAQPSITLAPIGSGFSLKCTNSIVCCNISSPV